MHDGNPQRPSGYAGVEEFLNAQDAARPRRREHHLPSEEYARTDAVFFLTLCARHHGSPFRNPRLADQVVQEIEHRRKAGRWWVYAYCLMPDHLHLVLQLRPAIGERSQPNLLSQLGDFKSFTTRHAWESGLQGRLWQHDQYDRLLRSDREFETRCRYVLNNPVRKEWVEDWTLWPYNGIPDDW